MVHKTNKKDMSELRGVFCFFPFKILNFNADYAELFTKFTMSQSQDNLLENYVLHK